MTDATGTVVGIDLSLTSTGLALTENGKLTSIHTVKSSPVTKGGKKDTLEDRHKRLYQVANEVLEFITYKPANWVDMVVIEAPSYGSRYGNAHDRSGLWWIVVNALRNDRYPVAMVAPQGRAKYGTGAGNSPKKVVYAFVKELYTDLLGRRIPNNDVADAILLAAMGARYLGHPVEAHDVPEANLASLDGVLWPTV